ncbi:MAG: MFS transporter [Bacillota bacterium]|nr:MFS transporter [Bacillota bacterium]
MSPFRVIRGQVGEGEGTGERVATGARRLEPRPDRWSILAAVVLGGAMGPVDGSVSNVIMPVIAHQYGVGLAAVSWVVMVYLLVIGSTLLGFGRLGDMWGYRRIFRAGILVFTAGSAMSGAAPTFSLLLVARVIQALGAAMFMAVGPAILTAVFPAQERGRALGLNGMAIAAGLALGPTLGGTLTDLSNWRSVFYINLPIGLAALVWTGRVLPEGERGGGERFDLPGSLLALLSLGALLLAASEGESWGWGSPAILSATAVGLVVGLLFVLWELRVPEPMLDLTLFRSRTFSAASAAGLLSFMTQFVLTFLMPFYLQQLLGLDPLHAGLVMTAHPLMVLVLAPVAGALSDRIGTRSLAFAGLALSGLGLLLLTGLGPGAPAWQVAWRMAVYGLGTGIFQAPNNSAVMGAAPRSRLGIASSVLAAVRNVGMVLGVAVADLVFTARRSAWTAVLGGAGLAPAELGRLAFWFGLRDAWLVGALLAALGAALSLLREGRSPAGREAVRGEPEAAGGDPGRVPSARAAGRGLELPGGRDG